eukprot:g5155.t1
MKEDYKALQKARDDLTQRPGWRTTPSLLKKVKRIKKQSSILREEIAYRKKLMNYEEEVMVGSVQYCRSLEDRRNAYEWLMDSSTEWKGIPMKKRKSWSLRIKSLRRKINTGGTSKRAATKSTYGGVNLNTRHHPFNSSIRVEHRPKFDSGTFHVGLIERLKNRKRRVEQAASSYDLAFSRLQRWKDHENRLHRQVVLAKSRLAKVKSEGALGKLKLHGAIARNRISLLKAEASVIQYQEALDNHRSIVDDASGLPMGAAYDNMERSMALQKATAAEQIIRINMSLHAAVTQINWLHGYREEKFRALVQEVHNTYTTNHHKTASGGPLSNDTDATSEEPPPPLVAAPSVFWPQELIRDSLDSPSTTLLLQWHDPIQVPDETVTSKFYPHEHSICGYKLLVYQSTLHDEDVQEKDSNFNRDGVEDKPKEAEEETGELAPHSHAINHSTALFVLDNTLSRDVIMLNDKHLNFHVDQSTADIEDISIKTLSIAESSRRNTLRVTCLLPNTAYRFQICTLAKSKNGEKKKKKKKKKTSSDMEAYANLIESRPSQMTQPKLTSVDYPSPVLEPMVDFSNSTSLNRPGVFAAFTVRWKKPKQFGMDIEGYRLEYKIVKGVSKAVDNKKPKKTEETASDIAAGNGWAGSGDHGGVKFNSSGSASVRAEDWMVLRTTPHDPSKSHYDMKVFIGENTAIQAGCIYKVRICSYMRVNGGVRFSYYIHGEESKQFATPPAPKEKQLKDRASGKRKSKKSRAKKEKKGHGQRPARASQIGGVQNTMTRNARNARLLRQVSKSVNSSGVKDSLED